MFIIFTLFCIFAGAVDTGVVEAACPNFPYFVPPGNTASLINAINCANSNGPGTYDTINLSGGPYTLAGVDNSTDGGNGLPVIVNAGGAGGLIIYGNGSTISRSSASNFRIMEVASGGYLELHDITLQNGNMVSGAGGGILNFGTLTVTNGTLSGNYAISGGGGIFNFGNTVLIHSTLSGNSSSSSGGGINVNSGSVVLTNSTLSGNHASSGGGIMNQATLTVTNSTFSGNFANNGGGIVNYSTMTVSNSTLSGNYADANGGGLVSIGSTTLNNSIIAKSSSGGDCYGGLSSNYSLVQDGSCNVIYSGSGNLTGDPKLGTLTGSPAYYPLLLGSPAINMGNNALIPGGILTDVAGNARIIGSAVDMGAYESAVTVTCPSFPHTIPDGNVADLINAITCANGTASNDVINLHANGLYTLLSADNTTDGGNGLPVIASASTAGTLTINGNGATIERSSAETFRLIEVGSGGDLTLDGVTIRNGNGTWGGGILNYIATLTILNSTIADNSSGSSGGGIWHYGTLTVSGSTFSNNTASIEGGGLFNDQSSAIISNSTFFGNTAGTVGGGIENLGDVDTHPTMTVTNSTFSGNSALYGGNIDSRYATLTLNNSVIANNTNGGDCNNISGTVNANHSLIEDGSCGVGTGPTYTNGNLSGDPLLSAAGLANNGGSTLTIALQAGSPAINAGSNTLAVDVDGTTPLAYDQRGSGFPRIVGVTVDMGAYEADAGGANGTVSGTIFENDGLTPLSGTHAWVQAYIFDGGDYVTAVDANPDGTYTFPDLPTGTYRIRAQADNHVPEFYSNAFLFTNALPVTVSAGTATLNINFSLEPGGTISGHVYENDGSTPVTSGTVTAESFTSGNWANAGINADGSYQIVGVWVGDYHVRADAYGHALEYYDEAGSTGDSATVVSVSAGTDVPNVNFTLAPGGSISGTVTAEDGVTPVVNRSVNVQGAWIGTCTDASGHYTLERLPLNVPLTVTTTWQNGCGGGNEYIGEWWQNAAIEGNATPITLTTISSQKTGIDFTLALSGSISGHVHETDGTTPITIDLSMDGSLLNSWPAWGMAVHPAADGSYTLSGIVPGDYFVSMKGGSYALEDYNEAGWMGQNMTVVTVTAGGNVPNIDFTLDPGGTISGTVHQADGMTPIPNQVVLVGNLYFGTCTDVNGNYTLTNLPLNAPLKINTDWDNFCDSSTKYTGEYWQEVPDDPSATPITLTLAQRDVPGIDFTLTPAATITGHVYQADGVTPVTSGVLVSVERTDGWLSWHGSSLNADGSYLISRLPAGTYRVLATGDTYVSEYYDNVVDMNNATLITIGTGQSVTNIDFTLAPAVSPGDVTLNFNSLPSAQGWTYSDPGAGNPEAASFNVSGGQLHQTVYGQDFYSTPHYDLHDVVIPDQPFTLTVRARVTNYSETNQNPWGFVLYVFADSELYSLGISPARIVAGDNVEVPFSFDVSQMHTYRMEGTPGAGYKLFVDDVLLATIPAQLSGGSGLNYLQFGDGTGGAQANVDIESYLFVNHAAASCPSFPYTVAAEDTASLINAITCANNNGAGSNDVINLATNRTYTLTTVDNSDASFGDNGLPVIVNAATAGTLTIHGNGATIERDGSADAFRILEVASGGNLTIDHTTIKGGHSNTGGGVLNEGMLAVSSSTFSGNSGFNGNGIFNDQSATLTVTDSVFSGNIFASDGGGIENSGTATIVRSVFSGNTAVNFGSGIYNSSTGILTVISSTFSNNGSESVGSDGGINNGGSATVTNSTFSDNTHQVIFNRGTLTLTNSTVSGNSPSNTGGSISNSIGTITLNNTIVAKSTNGIDCYIYSGTVTVNHSLISDGSCGVGTGPSYTNGNLSGDPLLDPAGLANNGGPTQTIALQASSPAINAGSNALALDPSSNPLQYDQRGAGYPRIIGGTVDMGAYEAAITAPHITMQPQNQTIVSGNTASLSVAATGQSLTYQWYQGTAPDTGTPISGATAASFVTPVLTSTTSFWVRVTNPAGNADSNSATVTVQPATQLAFLQQPTKVYQGTSISPSITVRLLNGSGQPLNQSGVSITLALGNNPG
ncbi:MAG: choice-of-anchor Q domain-containing protein, partial [Chloroflexota bacterium]